MSFVPISIADFVREHCKTNRGANEKEQTDRLTAMLEQYNAGERCYCGNPIWVIGSAETGLMCFTCITGEAVPSDDYEIAGACDKHHAPDARKR